MKGPSHPCHRHQVALGKQSTVGNMHLSINIGGRRQSFVFATLPATSWWQYDNN